MRRKVDVFCVSLAGCSGGGAVDAVGSRLGVYMVCKEGKNRHLSLYINGAELSFSNHEDCSTAADLQRGDQRSGAETSVSPEPVVSTTLQCIFDMQDR